MKIAFPTRDGASIAGHAGRARNWLVYDLADLAPGAALPAPVRLELAPGEVIHHFGDAGPHPLDGVDLVVTASAGDGFVRHMRKRGADVVMTGETDPAAALAHIVAGEAQPDPRFDITTSLCKLKDLFSHH
jgi:predicted Fe-Mo cluster-binding NifX family protein